MGQKWKEKRGKNRRKTLKTGRTQFMRARCWRGEYRLFRDVRRSRNIRPVWICTQGRKEARNTDRQRLTRFYSVRFAEGANERASERLRTTVSEKCKFPRTIPTSKNKLTASSLMRNEVYSRRGRWDFAAWLARIFTRQWTKLIIRGQFLKRPVRATGSTVKRMRTKEIVRPVNLRRWTAIWLLCDCD